jgi:hypothetical protein
MGYDNQVSLGASVSAYGVAYLTGATRSVLAFTSISPIIGREVAISGPGWTARIDQAYQNTQFAVVSADRSSSIFTANTATASQTVAFNEYKTVTGETRRLATLGYL